MSDTSKQISYMKFRTRRGKLEHKLNEEFNKNNPSLDNIIDVIEEYESDNINSIEKLKKKKKVTVNKINGALKQTINAHGPITKQLIGSAGKRIYGSLLEPEEEQKCNGRAVALVTFIVTTIINFITFSLFF